MFNNQCSIFNVQMGSVIICTSQQCLLTFILYNAIFPDATSLSGDVAAKYSVTCKKDEKRYADEVSDPPAADRLQL